MSENLWDRIEQSRSRWNVLEHPFYRRWSEGELTVGELAHYAGQYRHAVTTIAEMSAAAAADAEGEAREALARHAAEEASHIPLWDGFVRAVGGNPASDAEAETAGCIDAWRAGGGLALTLVRLYAIESGQPEIARTKREGLNRHYGIGEDEAIEYFTLHEELDRQHAAQSRELVELLAADAGVDELSGAAEDVFRANWRLLDGVERVAGPTG